MDMGRFLLLIMAASLAPVLGQQPGGQKIVNVGFVCTDPSQYVLNFPANYFTDLYNPTIITFFRSSAMPLQLKYKFQCRKDANAAWRPLGGPHGALVVTEQDAVLTAVSNSRRVSEGGTSAKGTAPSASMEGGRRRAMRRRRTSPTRRRRSSSSGSSNSGSSSNPRRRTVPPRRRRASSNTADTQAYRRRGAPTPAPSSPRRRVQGVGPTTASNGNAATNRYDMRRRNTPGNTGSGAGYGYTNQNKMNTNYNGQNPQQTSYGYSGKSGYGAGTVAAAAVGGMAVGVGGYYMYNQYQNSRCSSGSILYDCCSATCNNHRRRRSNGCQSGYTCESGGCPSNCAPQLNSDLYRDDMMNTGFIPQDCGYEWLNGDTVGGGTPTTTFEVQLIITDIVAMAGYTNTELRGILCPSNLQDIENADEGNDTTVDGGVQADAQMILEQQLWVQLNAMQELGDPADAGDSVASSAWDQGLHKTCFAFLISMFLIRRFCTQMVL